MQGLSDDLMLSLSTLISSNLPSEATSAQQKSFVTYTLSSLQTHPSALSSASKAAPDTSTLTILEARSIIASSGTTGIRTWEAALHLGNYLSTNSHLVRGKSILELGVGTGYISILCAKHLGASHVIASDGSDDVVADLPTNFYINGLQDTAVIEAKELKWGHALIGSEHPQWNSGRNIDVVLGADVTYENSAILALVSTFAELFTLYPGLIIILAATIRNPATFAEFERVCKARKFAIEEVDFGVHKKATQNGPFFSDAVPIKICVIKSS